MRQCFLAVCLCLAGLPVAVDAYVLEGYKWASPTTSFSTAFLPAGRWDADFSEAMNRWNSRTVFSFSASVGTAWDPCPAPASNISPGRYNSAYFASTECGSAWGTNVLAVTRIWYGSSTIKQTSILLNSNYTWDAYDSAWSPSNKDFRRVAVHELGHAMGLDHETSASAIMAPTASDIIYPTPDDIAGVVAMYGGTTSTTATTTTTDAQKAEKILDCAERLASFLFPSHRTTEEWPQSDGVTAYGRRYSAGTYQAVYHGYYYYYDTQWHLYDAIENLKSLCNVSW